MNLALLASDLTSTAKLIYLLIEEGYDTPIQIRRILTISEMHVHRSLSALMSHGFIMQKYRGVYALAEVRNPHPGARIPTAEVRIPHAEVSLPTAEVRNPTPRVSARAQYLLKDKTVKKEKVFVKKPEEEEKLIPLKSFLSRVDLHEPKNAELRENTRKVLAERDLSPDLVDRITVARVLEIPGFDRESLIDVRKEAEQLQKDGKLRFRWIHQAKYVQDAFAANGIEWIPCRSARQCRLDSQVQIGGHKVKTCVGQWMCEILDAAKENDPSKFHNALHGK